LADTEKIVVVFKPSDILVSVSKKTTLLEAAEKAEIVLPSVCGGKGKCGKCKIRILNKEIPFTKNEDTYLTLKEKAKNIHLACQVSLESELEVEIPESLNDANYKFLTDEGVAEFEIDDHLKLNKCLHF
jgi:ferredoxin